MGGGVGRRQRDSDDEVGGHEAEQHQNESLPCHHGSSRSSIAIEPSPWGLSAATRRSIGRAPNRVSGTSRMVATGDSTPVARAAMPGWYPRVEK
jgi:hypothetical protein